MKSLNETLTTVKTLTVSSWDDDYKTLLLHLPWLLSLPYMPRLNKVGHFPTLLLWGLLFPSLELRSCFECFSLPWAPHLTAELFFPSRCIHITVSVQRSPFGPPKHWCRDSQRPSKMLHFLGVTTLIFLEVAGNFPATLLKVEPCNWF